MEMMPYHVDLRGGQICASGVVRPSTAGSSPAAIDLPATWRAGLPTLRGVQLQLRELRLEDAPSLLALLTREEVARFISPPPTTVVEFKRFITWTHSKRREGSYVCFAVVPEGLDTAVGIFQVRVLEPNSATAEWGFALGMPYWGRGLFLDGATLVVSFAFDTLGVRRLEARACVENGRGTGALRKVGAICEGILRGAFVKDGQVHDQGLWTILRDEWHAITRPWKGTVH